MRPESQRRCAKMLRQQCARLWITLLVLAAIAGICAASPSERADAERTSPEEVEAAYLYNFGKFVRWPGPQTDAPITICVANQDDILRIATGLVHGEEIDGRPLQVRRLDEDSQVRDCAIMFIGGTQASQMDAYLSGAAGKPVLTVGDAPDFLAHGGIIRFVVSQNHVRFSVNLNAARRNHLQLSSELLKVAIQVVGESAEGGL